MTEICLVRHGRTEWNATRRLQGRTDIPLDDVGRAQAVEAAQTLAAQTFAAQTFATQTFATQTFAQRWDAVVTSPLQRAQQTAMTIADRLGLPAPVVDDGLIERDYGIAEGAGNEEYARRWSDGVIPGRELDEAVALRMQAALDRIADAHDRRRVVAVSHGGAIRVAVNTIQGHNPADGVANLAATLVVRRDGHWTVEYYNRPLLAGPPT